MKKVTIIFIIMLYPIIIFADPYWRGTPYGPGRWLFIEELEYQGDFLPIHKAGGVPISEINYHQLLSMGSGHIYAGYFTFFGDYEVIPFEEIYIKFMTFMWPPSLITPGELIPGRLNAYQWTYSFICGCTREDDPFPPDSARLADGHGYWERFEPPPPEWWYWEGYLYALCHAHPCKIIPCPAGGGQWEKLWVYFTDSLYTQDREISDDGIVSGDSRLYIRANYVGGWSGTKHVRLFLRNNPGEYEIVVLQDIGYGSMIGSFESARVLGLESCDDAVVELYTYVDPDTSTLIGSDEIVVCLPRVTTSVDTVIIRTDSMKISQDFQVGLEFIDDQTGENVYSSSHVDSAGYRYSSFWVANANLSDTLEHQRYDRIYPRDSTYLWWDDTSSSIGVQFRRDSLYVVGGSLSVKCIGALAPVSNINNNFTVTTDTLINDTLRATKFIIVDKDPANSLFEDTLRTDRIRAIAWQEYAGSADPRHCHEGTTYNDRWNHYWDLFINSIGDTCFDTRTPCENRFGTDTGLMQIYRKVWETTFDSTAHIGEYPQTFIICRWDSLAWNWKINLFNGKWIYFVDNFYHINQTNPPNPQRNWDSLYFPASDYTPDSTNKEDIVVYGYKEGATKMKKIKTQEDWDNNIVKNDYVLNVRRFKDTKPWIY
jgi:hypothetical protein